MNEMNRLPPIQSKKGTGNVLNFPGVNTQASAELPAIGTYDRTTIEQAKLKLNYQPQIHLATGEIRGIEALLRPSTEAGESLCTADFVAVAEREGLINTLGTQVLRLACAEFATLGGATGRFGRLAINVSALQLRQANFAETVVETVLAAGLSFDQVELEITESWSLDDPSLKLDTLYQLAELGIRLAIDDFGTGHAVWSHVLKAPFSTLKIDRTLAGQVIRDDRVRTIIQSVCDACRQLEIEVVAEGICSREQRDRLMKLGCSVGQGFGLSGPLAPNVLADFTQPNADCRALHLIG